MLDMVSSWLKNDERTRGSLERSWLKKREEGEEGEEEEGKAVDI